MDHTPELYVLTYHYIRELPTTRFPGIKGMLLTAFRQQIELLKGRFELATLESTLAFLSGSYHPARDLCLLTFDDGLREHYTDITPILVENGMQGIFFVITSCLEDSVVVPVHMNHFLMAQLGLDRYQSALFEAAGPWKDDFIKLGTRVEVACRTYPWDAKEIAQFKYWFNFVLPPEVCYRVVKDLFELYIESESTFASELYLTWHNAREMQAEGMVIGGHTHRHRSLNTVNKLELKRELRTCRALMDRNLGPQRQWPFSYPFGKSDSFNSEVVKVLQDLGFCCAVCTERGANSPGIDKFAIRRFDGSHFSAVN